jgi:hypothetical protein
MRRYERSFEVTVPGGELGYMGAFTRFPALVAAAICLLTCLTVARDALGQPSGEVKDVTMKKAVMPVYLDFASPAVAVLRADAIYPSHQRWGYFRIGLLPMLACDGVTLEVCDAQKAVEALAGMRENLKSQANGTIVELHQVAIRFLPETTPRLKAATVRLPDKGQWQLSDILLQTGTNVISASRALLQVAGPQAGRLTWQSPAGMLSANLFAVQSTTNNLAIIQKTP